MFKLNYNPSLQNKLRILNGKRKGELFTKQSRIFTTLRKRPFENIVGKGENAGKSRILNGRRKGELFTKQSQVFTTGRKRPFENIMGKGENAGNHHFLLFPQSFLPFQQKIAPLEQIVVCKCFQFGKV